MAPVFLIFDSVSFYMRHKTSMGSFHWSVAAGTATTEREFPSRWHWRDLTATLNSLHGDIYGIVLEHNSICRLHPIPSLN